MHAFEKSEALRGFLRIWKSFNLILWCFPFKELNIPLQYITMFFNCFCTYCIKCYITVLLKVRALARVHLYHIAMYDELIGFEQCCHMKSIYSNLTAGNEHPLIYMYRTHSGHSASSFVFKVCIENKYTNKNVYNVVSVYFFYYIWVFCVEKKTTEIVVFSSAFHDLSSQDCKQSNSMQTSALLNLDKKNFNIFFCAQQLPI